jgi:biopolymer transport protein ExbB/biopolymer transport protein TolQ
MQQFTLSELWSHMGLFARLVVYMLGLMSASSVLVMAERLVFFWKSNRSSRRFAGALATQLGKSGVDEAAAQKREGDLGHLGRVLSAGLGAYRMTTTAGTSADLTVESVARAVERQAAREVDNLKRGLNLLATVGSTAPFVGLLGTVVGIINAFQSMAATGSGGLGTVSAGIAEALVTTAFGLLVAIPAVMAFNYMQGWVDGVSVDMSESSNELLDVVARRLGSASGTPKPAPATKVG